MKKNIKNRLETIMIFGQKKGKELPGLNLTQKLKMLFIAKQKLILNGSMMEL